MTTPIERLRQRHVAAGFPDNQCCVVLSCGLTWPCDTVAALDALEAERDELRARVNAVPGVAGRRRTVSCENCANAYDEGYTAGHNAENARLREALEAQGLLQKKPSGSFVWHAYDCQAAFDFAQCNARCRIARPMIREEWR